LLSLLLFVSGLEYPKLRTLGKPFRWNMASSDLMRRLGRGQTDPIPDYEQDRLLRLAANVLRAGGDSDFVFVGRSLESVYDLLCGALSRATWYDRVQLLQLSFLNIHSPEELHQQHPDRAANLRSYFTACQLTPRQIMERARPVVFVDIVALGFTFDNLSRLLRFWSNSSAVWRRVRQRLVWVAVLPDDGGWPATGFKRSQVQRVFLNRELWCYLADEQLKTTESYTLKRWGDPGAGCAPNEEWFLYAARVAHEFYRQGEKSRRRLAALLDEPPQPIPLIASLARELRREARSR
jgi:hypothetical protein